MSRNDSSASGARSYAIAVQAERRDAAYICEIQEYMDARYDNIGAGLVFAMAEVALETDIPHEVMESPAISSMVRDAGDMITLANVRPTSDRSAWH